MTHSLVPFLDRLATEAAVLVTVLAPQGSVPREAGAWMAVWPDTTLGTIGGGHLEWQAIALARQALGQRVRRVWRESFSLGPSLGQCCGGRLQLQFETVDAGDGPALAVRLCPSLQPVALFGSGHVGSAIVQALAPLPFAVHWVDSRDEVFPVSVPPQVQTDHSDPVAAAVPGLAAGTFVLIMSFSHAEDLDIVAACLLRWRTRRDLPFVGLIGSRTKWQVFRRRLADRGFSAEEMDHVTCPIGLPGIAGKAPAVIAASVVAQLLLLQAQTVRSIV